MQAKTLTIPEIVFIGVTRGVIGFGAGLLLADKFNSGRRKSLGWTLFVSGLASTIPIAMRLLNKKEAVAGD